MTIIEMAYDLQARGVGVGGRSIEGFRHSLILHCMGWMDAKLVLYFFVYIRLSVHLGLPGKRPI